MSELTVVRASAALPASTTETLFSVVGGLVLVTGLVGLVTELIDDTNTSEIKFGAATLWTGNPVGFTDTYVIGASSGNGSATPISGRAVRDGANVTLTTTATTGGAVEWVLTYRPLTPGAYVEAVV